MKNEIKYTDIGARAPRVQANEQLNGKALYTDDINLPGMLHAKGVRSQHAHARILSVDISRASRLPGVKAIITGKDIPNNHYGLSVKDQYLLCEEKVNHLGDFIAVVAATDEDLAAEAASLVKVEYEPLPAVRDIFAALDPGAPIIHGGKDNRVPFAPDGMRRMRCGDIEKGFKEADMIVEDEYLSQRVEHAPIEPYSAVANIDGNNRLAVWLTCGMPFIRCQQTASILKLPLSKIRFIIPNVGGGFGGKNEFFTAPYVAVLAQKTGKPVKWTWTREEEFLCSSVKHPFLMRHKTGVKKNGKIVAKKIETIGDTGAYCMVGVGVLEKHVMLACGPYAIPNVWIDGYLVYTNKQPSAAFRGLGVPQACYSAELQMDHIARELNMDPLEFRLVNALKEGDRLPSSQKLVAVGITQCLEALRLEYSNM
jgi:nicotinate dehydrogenase large molybdopterin subunit